MYMLLLVRQVSKCGEIKILKSTHIYYYVLCSYTSLYVLCKNSICGSEKMLNKELCYIYVHSAALIAAAEF